MLWYIYWPDGRLIKTVRLWVPADEPFRGSLFGCRMLYQDDAGVHFMFEPRDLQCHWRGFRCEEG